MNDDQKVRVQYLFDCERCGIEVIAAQRPFGPGYCSECQYSYDQFEAKWAKALQLWKEGRS